MACGWAFAGVAARLMASSHIRGVRPTHPLHARDFFHAALAARAPWLGLTAKGVRTDDRNKTGQC
jgi:hypothetical protein